MTIEIITGTPGAGKTTYAVVERIIPEAGREIKLSDEACDALHMPRGSKLTRRVVVSGIRGLACEHERLPHMLTGDDVKSSEVEKFNAMRHDVEDQPVFQRLAGEPPREDVIPIVQNWWLWCKPGDLIVLDEAHFAAPRATMGKRAPYWIDALSIHRHYGVDFLFISQDHGRVDIAIRKLCGDYKHIRSVLGTATCMVYAWDHAGSPEKTALAHKRIWRRKSWHYKRFHSAVAHLPKPTQGRGLAIVLPLLVLACGVLVWKFSQRFDEKKAAPGALPASGSPGVPGQPLARSNMPIALADKSRIAGCYAFGGDQCRCFDGQGAPVPIAYAMCLVSSYSYDGVVRYQPRAAFIPSAPASAAPSRFPPPPLGL